ncbi:MAG: ACP S-malonyltransferase [Candidatus Omnitrophota bacterium]
MSGKKYGLLFPGQGSQTIGMCKEFYQTQTACRWVFDRANEILGRDIAKLCFEGPEDELMTTANSQPAIFTASIAALNVLIEKLKASPVGEEGREIFSSEDIRSVASVSMGLSLGEPTALVACGAISFEDGLRFVRERGLLMEQAAKKDPGKMASIIGLDLEKVEELCVGVGCQVANLNCPGQVVISGSAEKIELAADLAKSQGAKRVVVLKVSGAFHSRLMSPAKEKLKTFLETIEIKEPVIDFISNIDAELTRNPVKIKENLADQLDNKTLWEASVEKAASLGITDYLEVGPGTVLKGLFKKIDRSLNVFTVHTLEDIGIINKNMSDEATCHASEN